MMSQRVATGLSAAFFLTVCLILATHSAPAAAADAPDPNRVVAVVNGYEIRMTDVDQAREMLPPEAQNYPPKVIFDYLLGTIVNSRVVAEQARKDGLAKSPEIQRQLARVEERVLEREYMLRRIDKELSDEKVRAAFDRLIKETPPEQEVRARHILVASEKAAEDVIARLNKGEDFAAIAKQVSTDGSAQAGGDLGYFTHDRMVKPFADAAFAMTPGTYGTKPVRSQFGWHIIKVEDKRAKAPPTFAEAEDEVRAAAQRELAESFIAELRAKAKIETFGIEGRPAKGKAAPAKSDDKGDNKGK